MPSKMRRRASAAADAQCSSGQAQGGIKSGAATHRHLSTSEPMGETTHGQARARPPGATRGDDAADAEAATGGPDAPVDARRGEALGVPPRGESRGAWPLTVGTTPASRVLKAARARAHPARAGQRAHGESLQSTPMMAMPRCPHAA